MSIRLAASVAAAALLCACTGAKSGSTGPPNAPVAAAGRPGAIPLDPAQRRELDATVAKMPAAVRARLRYALAAGEDGQRHLVVYDGEGLGVSGRHPGKPHEYVIFKVLNATNGEHYDPQQNSVVAAIPPPPERESPVKP